MDKTFKCYYQLLTIAKCGYINEDLFSYVIRSDSHSNEKHTMKDLMKQDKEHEAVVLQLLDIIQPKNKASMLQWFEVNT